MGKAESYDDEGRKMEVKERGRDGKCPGPAGWLPEGLQRGEVSGRKASV